MQLKCTMEKIHFYYTVVGISQRISGRISKIYKIKKLNKISRMETMIMILNNKISYKII